MLKFETVNEKVKYINDESCKRIRIYCKMWMYRKYFISRQAVRGDYKV